MKMMNEYELALERLARNCKYYNRDYEPDNDFITLMDLIRLKGSEMNEILAWLKMNRDCKIEMAQVGDGMTVIKMTRVNEDSNLTYTAVNTLNTYAMEQGCYCDLPKLLSDMKRGIIAANSFSGDRYEKYKKPI